MSQPPFLDHLKSGQILIADGATGTNLIERGLPRGISSENWVLEKPEEIVRLHKDFIEAGSQIILTCTFGANTFRLDESGLSGREIEVNQRAVQLARQAVGEKAVYVAASIGPLGKLLKPYGPLSFDEAKSIYRTQIQILVETEIDLLVIETQFDNNEAASAVQAVREQTDMPLVVSFSYDRGRKTMMGVDPTKMAAAMMEYKVDVLGINCGRSLDDNLNSLKELKQATSLPIWFKPNAGMPVVDDNGNSNYSLDPLSMGAKGKEWLEAGAAVIGGCCGTTPAHLKAIASSIQ